ncbi:TetR/AcrR family transcriptional regulator [Microbacterium protaetiae]|uniref:TetR/AcrR family transcriptional regulator n=1 Tax=Microbacterium protaetiae TaxID=2509458 RepID=UPI0013EE08F2|nr:TetR/AcrR family transcriptional regulator [Microbacterium protaetiae]
MNGELRGKQQRGVEAQRALLEAAGAVFARLSYAEARLQDIADEAGISTGSLFFHLGNKTDIAHTVLATQQERMGLVLTEVLERGASTLDKIIGVFDGLAELVASDPLVQGGIRLSLQPATELDVEASTPYQEWVAVAARLVADGQKDGSVRDDIDVALAAELLNELFVGAQVLAGLEDSWQSLPLRVQRGHRLIRGLLAPQRAASSETHS